MGSTTVKMCGYVPSALVTNIDIGGHRKGTRWKLLDLSASIQVQRFHTEPLKMQVILQLPLDN
jgi:hypothetical protein